MVLLLAAGGLAAQDGGRVQDDLLVALSRTDITERRRALEEVLDRARAAADAGDAELALRLAYHANALAPPPPDEKTARRRALDAALEDAVERRTEHFLIRHPAGAPGVEIVAAGLEREHARLRQWIHTGRGRAKKIRVDLFPLVDFLRAFASGPHGGTVVGRYAGRLLLPLADVERLTPTFEEILTHELVHALVAERTAGRAPRWLQEGLAQLQGRELRAAAPRPRTPPRLAGVEAAFAARGRLGPAYRDAALLVRHALTLGGVEGLGRLFDAYAQGLEDAAALRQAFGVGVAEFEEGAAPLARQAGQDDANERTSLMESAMARWHGEDYAPGVANVKRLLASVRADGDESCAALRTALADVRRDRHVLRPPDDRAGEALRRAFDALRDFAGHCGRAGANQLWEDAEKRLAGAAVLLEPYGLHP